MASAIGRRSSSTVLEIVAKVLLVGVTVFAMLSLGGLLMYVFPPLAVGHWWAARRSGRFERWGWIALSSAAAAEWAWEVTYALTDGERLLVWIVPAAAAATALVVLVMTTRSSVPRRTA